MVEEVRVVVAVEVVVMADFIIFSPSSFTSSADAPQNAASADRRAPARGSVLGFNSEKFRSQPKWAGFKQISARFWLDFGIILGIFEF